MTASRAPSPSGPPRAGVPKRWASGRYEIQRFLGEGAKKRVYLARDTRLDRDVALALIKTDGLDPETRIRVGREARAMGRLGDHPNIVTVFDIAEEDGQPYLVSQYMRGGDLEGMLRDSEASRLPIETAVRIGREICLALEHAHDRGIVHRDLKPGNVWLADDGTAKLGDFGLAIAADRSRLTQEGMMVGTAAYLAPEQAISGNATSRSDLYSLGALLYEMVAGRPPFVGADTVSVISQHLNTPPVAPSWHNDAVPGALEGLILRLLAKDPEGRPESARFVREALDRVSLGEPRPQEAGPEERINPLDALATGVFVGREEELQQLRSGVDRMLSGRGSVLMLVGEPGIGKTRTAEELVTYARMRGAQALIGRCYEGEGAPSFWPWVQIIRSYVHEREPSQLLSEMGPGAADIAEVVSDVRTRLPGLPQVQKLEPDQARFRLFDSVSTFLRNAATRKPLVLVLDDLHWADKLSLLLLQFVSREIAGSRLLVLGTYRDVELSRQHPLANALAELARSELSTRVLLRGLREEDVERFIRQAANVEPPRALVETVFRETEGNPFFIGEIVRLLAREGRLDHPERERSWSLTVPQGVREVVGRRLNALSEECNRMLQVASVIGRQFDADLLMAAAQTDRDAILAVLDEGLAARVIEEIPDALNRYGFSHALVKETLYEELTTPQRVRLHQRIGDLLEERHRDRLEPHLDELAHHFFQSVQGGSVEKAITYTMRAGDHAAQVLGYDEAADHFERALHVLDLKDEVDEASRFEILYRLGDARFKAGDRERSHRALERAADVARRTGDAERLAQAVLPIVDGQWEPGLMNPESIRLLEEARDALPDVESALRVHVLSRWAREHFALLEGRDLMASAHAMAERVGDPEGLTFVLLGRYFIMSQPEDARERLSLTHEMSRLAAQTGNEQTALYALYNRFQTLLQLGEVQAADEALAEAVRLGEETRQPRFAWDRTVTTAARAILDGRFEEAESLAQEAYAVGQRFGIPAALQIFGIQISRVRAEQGRLAELENLVKSMVERLPNVAAWRGRLAADYCERGLEADARPHYEILAKDDFASIPRDGTWLIAITYAAQICHHLRDIRRAPVLYDLLLPCADLNVMVGGAAVNGPVARWLGLLAWTLGRFEEAAGHLEAAIASAERMGARPLEARIRLDYGRMFLERGGPGDRERALDLINRSLTTARELKMKLVLERALAAKLEVQGVASGSISTSIDVVSASIDRRRPDLGPHAAPDGTVTLMFSDMQGFTEMTERLGDLKAREVIREHNRIVRSQVAAHDGYEVELQGDGFLIAFGSARNALLCAVGIQRGFSAHNRSHGDTPIRVRIGLHTGEALKDADKFFGRTVILAARIAAQADGEEILASSLLRDLTRSVGDIRFGEPRDVALKGISETQRLYPVDWS